MMHCYYTRLGGIKISDEKRMFLVGAFTSVKIPTPVITSFCQDHNNFFLVILKHASTVYDKHGQLLTHKKVLFQNFFISLKDNFLCRNRDIPPLCITSFDTGNGDRHQRIPLRIFLDLWENKCDAILWITKFLTPHWCTAQILSSSQLFHIGGRVTTVEEPVLKLVGLK